MTKRLVIVGLTLAAATAAAALTVAPATAHHTGPEACDVEVGIWTKSNRARSGLTTSEQLADAKVSTPPAATCKDYWRTNWWRRTSANYNVIDTTITPDIRDSRSLLDYNGYTVGGQSDYLNARTTGSLVPPSVESVNLYVKVDGGVKVWFDGNLVIDEWHDNASPQTYWYATPVLSPSMEYQVVIEYYHKTGTQQLELYWKTASTNIVKPVALDLNGNATQHSAIHARDASGANCTETVAYRMSGGQLWVWGYGCGHAEDADADPEVIDLGAYQPAWITLWQKWNGNSNPSTWGHWVYRWDTSQWVYIGSTGPRPSSLYGWLESSGYNAGSTRDTAFDNYKEGGTLVDVSVCPETEDFDTHQEMDPSYFPTGGKFFPATSNTC